GVLAEIAVDTYIRFGVLGITTALVTVVGAVDAGPDLDPGGAAKVVGSRAVQGDRTAKQGGSPVHPFPAFVVGRAAVNVGVVGAGAAAARAAFGCRHREQRMGRAGRVAVQQAGTGLLAPGVVALQVDVAAAT